MIESSIPDIDVEELMEKIRAEIKQRKKSEKMPSESMAAKSLGPRSGPLQKIGLDGVSSVPNPENLQIKDSYHINDFLKFRDRNFVMAAYRGILGRRPDSGGLNHYLIHLRSGKMTKAEILGRLRYSREGRVIKKKVKGLFWNFFIQSSFGIPVLGYCSRLIFGVGNLPLILRNVRVFEERASTQSESFSNELGKMQSKIEAVFEVLERWEPILNDKIDGSEWVALKEEMDTTFASKADRNELLVLKEEMDTTFASKADRNELLVLKEEMDTTFASKADRNELLVLKEEMDTTFASKADRNELLVLKEEMDTTFASKADRNELLVLKEEMDTTFASKADRNELLVLKEEMDTTFASKADCNELVVLKDEMGATLEGKANNDQVLDILRQVRNQKLKILDQQRRLKLLLEEARKRFSESIPNKQIMKMVKEEPHIFDADYVSFEDQFRGTRAEIKERQRIYLPHIRNAGVGTKQFPQFPVLDIGCGRGEWLELLKDENFVAMGVDRNRILVEECRGLGLEVVEGDAVEYLRSVPDISIGAVTGFHIIEHLPFDSLVALLDETVRVLTPGGISIFETPNPENILVGAFKYYYDPTHRNPLPPVSTQFLFESRGLSRVEILRLHPDNSTSRLTDDGSELVQRFNEYFYGPQDYALIGYKQ